jgi:transposase
MESTGIYWKPIFKLLEGSDLTLLLRRRFRSVPGRKTDVRDAEWLVDLLRHGLLKASFVPPKQQRELRELVRYRRKLIEERTREYNRLEKTLEGVNIKLGAVASTMTGKSVREMLWALVHGEADTEAIAAKARGRLKQKHAALMEAREGFIGAHQRFMLAEQLGHLGERDGRIERISREVAERLGPFEAQLTALETIPGVGRRTAEDRVAEIGLDMSRFPTSRPLASWAKPGHERECGQTQERQDGAWQSLPAHGARGGRPCDGSQEGELLARAVPSSGGASGQEAGGRSGGAFDSGDRLSPAPRWWRP